MGLEDRKGFLPFPAGQHTISRSKRQVPWLPERQELENEKWPAVALEAVLAPLSKQTVSIDDQTIG